MKMAEAGLIEQIEALSDDLKFWQTVIVVADLKAIVARLTEAEKVIAAFIDQNDDAYLQAAQYFERHPDAKSKEAENVTNERS